VPLQNLAAGFARMAAGTLPGPARSAAARRILNACMAHPFYVSGTDKADLRLMEVGAGRIFTKIGAEGVFCAAVPELGLGIALKCDDGAARAAEVMVAVVLAGLLRKDADLSAKLAELARPVLTYWYGIGVGSLQPVGELADQLA
jgi:L-asparaginase II